MLARRSQPDAESPAPDAENDGRNRGSIEPRRYRGKHDGDRGCDHYPHRKRPTRRVSSGNPRSKVGINGHGAKDNP